MSKPTPAPWRAEITDLGGFTIVIGDTDLTYCVICQRADWGHRAAESAANARLIAAAPYMLETLRGINRVLSPGSRTLDEMMRDVGYAVDRARGAIEKATVAVAGAQEG